MLRVEEVGVVKTNVEALLCVLFLLEERPATW